MTNTNTKLTNRYALNAAIAALKGNTVPTDFAADEVVEKLEAMIAQLDKKNASPRKLTERQQENAGIADEIFDLLSDGVARTSGEIAKSIPSLAGENPQRTAGILRTMFTAGRVSKTTDKRKTYYSVN